MLIGLPLVITAGACSSSSGSSSEPAQTLVTVLPSTFAGDVVCGSFPGAWKTYVARLTDVTQSPPFALGWSDPVPCSMPVSFSWVIPGHQYTAEIRAYDRDDIEPALGFSTGSGDMVANGEVVPPRWTTTCGVTITDPADAGAEQDAGVDASVSGTATESRIQRNVVVRECEPLTVVPGSPESTTGIVLDLSTIRGSLVCGEEPGNIGSPLRVVPMDSSLLARTVPCDGSTPYAPLEADRLYRFRVEAYTADGAAVRWATECRGHTKQGVMLPAACDTLSDRGALRVDISALLELGNKACAEGDVVSYRAVLLGLGVGGAESACTKDASFNALSPSVYQVTVDAFDSEGNERLNALCEGTVVPASTTDVTCQIASD